VSEPDQPLFEATRRRARWGWRIALGSLLVVGFLCSAYVAIDSLGLEALLPVAALLVIGVQVGRWLGLGGRRGRLSRGGEEFIVFTAPYRQAQPGVVIDDMSVQMPPGWNVERVVDFVLAAKERDAPYEEVVPALMASGFSEDEALRAIDRTLGGLVRARFEGARNEPSKTKDPIAWTSYQRGVRQPALVATAFRSSGLGTRAPQPGTTELTATELAVLRNLRDAPDDTLKLGRRMVAARLSKVYGAWQDSGALVVGPEGMRVLVSQDRCGDPNALLLGFSLDREKGEPLMIWDCAHGIGKTRTEALERAVENWSQSTASVLLELRTRRGQFADHFHGADGGLPGWHLIQGPIGAFGMGNGPELLRDWVSQHPLVPQLADALAAAQLPRDEPTGMKFFLGSGGGNDIAEVKVKNVPHPELSAALARLPWPRFAEPAYARTFVLFVHRHEAGGVEAG